MTHRIHEGLRTGVKSAVVTALRDGLSDDFWRSVDDSLRDVTPQSLVLPEFPTKMWSLPLITVRVSFGRITWDNLSRYTLTAPLNLKQVAMTTATVTMDFYCESSLQRDRLADTFLNMIVFAYIFPSHSAFASRLHDYDENFGIDPVLSSVGVGSESAGTGIPWAADKYVYTTSMSFDMNVRWTMKPGEHIDGIKAIDVTSERPRPEGLSVPVSGSAVSVSIDDPDGRLSMMRRLAARGGDDA